jgi:hypothetical protein
MIGKLVNSLLFALHCGHLFPFDKFSDVFNRNIVPDLDLVERRDGKSFTEDIMIEKI